MSPTMTPPDKPKVVRPRLTYARADEATVQVVPEGEAEEVKATPSHTPPATTEPAPHIVALRSGAMLFIPGESHTSWHARMGAWPKANGQRVRQRRGERGGVAGHYVWLEALEGSK